MSELPDILGSTWPVIQGPIGSMNSPEMVAAVSEAGGFGMLALGFIRDIDEARSLVNTVRGLTDKPFGANVVIMNPLHREILEVLAGAGVTTVTTSVGQPGDIYPLIHELGMRGLHVVLSLAHAVKAETSGADGVVVAGCEAGGLRSRKPETSTMILVPLVCDHVSIPVVAAGGIADSRGYRAALALGAQGVQVGTRFLVSKESIVHEAWKQTVVDCGDGGTDLLPVGNMMTRAVVTPGIRKLMEDPSVNLEEELLAVDRTKAWETGDLENALAGAGQVSALIRDVKSVREIIEEMVS
ncbi:MAG TPA: nitronate monooxygenase [Deltaproteobacteria bacterium]|mgnify:CR=1 FL=1|nr:nitronate monooxygenase [Deltaproteobacteria bacterium]